MTLPRMAFEMNRLSYDATRKLNKTFTIVKNNNISDLSGNTSIDITNNKVLSTFTPVPYDIDFSLFVLTNTETDGSLIMDKIMPMFTPQLDIAIKMEPNLGIAYNSSIQDYINSFRNSMNIILDTPIILKSISMEDNYEGDFETRRSLIWTFQFTMRGSFFGPTTKSSVIKLPETSINPHLDLSIEHKRTQFEPYTPTKNWVQISIDDSSDILWKENDL